MPPSDRKQRLRAVVPRKAERLFYCDHVTGDGDVFRLACEHDLEGVVAKHKGHPYIPERETTWLKIRNREYSQWVGREEVFERERGSDPDAVGWLTCTAAAGQL